MPYFDPFLIPENLKNPQKSEDDISILIGENGSGKSTLLSYLAEHYSRSSIQVIAVANTIHDKFKKKNKRFFPLKASEGRSIIKKAIIECFATVARDELKRLSHVGNTLDYIGFNRVIGFKLIGLKYNALDLIAKSDLLPKVKEETTYCIEEYNRNFRNTGSAARVYIDSWSYSEVKQSFLLLLFKYEKELRKLKVIYSIDFFLYRGRDTIALHRASSGELTLIATLLYITSIISHDSVILIDEPENSLHPKWQMEYVKHLSELFYLYQPKIIIASHSPLIINGADLHSKMIQIYKGRKGLFTLHENETNNVEEIYQDYFDITTPENRFLSELIVKKLNKLANGEISGAKFEADINDLQNKSYDKIQKEVLSGIIEMGKKIINN